MDSQTLFCLLEAGWAGAQGDPACARNAVAPGGPVGVCLALAAMRQGVDLPLSLIPALRR